MIEINTAFQRNATITDSRLINATLISVKRSGVGYDIVYDTPVNRQAQSIPAEGKIKFDLNNPFGFVFEAIHIIYKT